MRKKSLRVEKEAKLDINFYFFISQIYEQKRKKYEVHI